MKRARLPLSIALALTSGIALAQEANDPMAQLRACSLMERTERLECLDKLSRAVTPSARPAPKGEGWIISQTTSPVDYAPIATATIASREVAGGSAMRLSIGCRRGRTELTLAGPAISGRGEDYVISYRVNGSQPVQAAAAVPSFGAGIAFKDDAVGLVQSLPSEGELAVQLSPRVGTVQDGIFSLVGLGTVRAKIATACKWPQAVATPNN
jgi:hypothetical protein